MPVLVPSAMLRLKHLLAAIQTRKASLGRATANMGLFHNLLLTSPRGFLHLAELVEQKSVDLVREIIRRQPGSPCPSPAEPTTVTLIDDLSNEICCAADLTDCVRSMHSDSTYAKTAEESTRKYTVLVETLNTTPELYSALKHSLTREHLDDVSRRTAKLLLHDFELSGVHLHENERKKFVQLSDQIFESGVRFLKGVDAPMQLSAKENKFGIPGNLLEQPWTGSPDYNMRKFTYGKYYEHLDTQEQALSRLVATRSELAKLTGFSTFSHRAQSHTILQSYENAHAFLSKIIQSLTPRLGDEIDAIRTLISKRSKNFNAATDGVGEWDVDFAAGLQRQSIYAELGGVADYFHFDSILSGFESLAARLYGLRFYRMFPDPGEIWPGNVLKLNVHKEEGDVFLGTIFLDVDARPTKVQGDCHFTVRCSKLMPNGKYQTPIVVLSLALVPPELQNLTGKESVFEAVTLSPHQTENFFHEMGHALHSMLGRTRFQHVAGTRCPTDFAEIPSHLMECFFNDPRVLQDVCRDKSGRRIHADQAKAIISARTLFSVTRTLQQALYALFDLQLHGPYAEEITACQLSTSELFRKYTALTLPGYEITPNYAYQHRIAHLVTYGGKYYSYLVAKHFASRIYDKLFAADPYSYESGAKWAEIQACGGEHESHYLLEKVLGMKAENLIEDGDTAIPTSKIS